MELTKIYVMSKHHLDHKNRKKMIDYVESLDLSFIWGIHFDVGVPQVFIDNKKDLAKKIQERFLDVLHGVE